MKNKVSQEIIETLNELDISSDRMNLKKFSIAEAEFNIAHEMDPDLMRYIRNPLPLKETREKTMKCVTAWKGEEKEWMLISIRLKSTNDYMGLLCLCYESIENNTIEIGWRLAHEYHGQGFATEAAGCLLDFIKSNLKPHKVVAYCVAENLASSNIMLKLGMQQEACLREHGKLGGQWYDEAIYGLIIN